MTQVLSIPSAAQPSNAITSHPDTLTNLTYDAKRLANIHHPHIDEPICVAASSSLKSYSRFLAHNQNTLPKTQYRRLKSREFRISSHISSYKCSPPCTPPESPLLIGSRWYIVWASIRSIWVIREAYVRYHMCICRCVMWFKCSSWGTCEKRTNCDNDQPKASTGTGSQAGGSTCQTLCDVLVCGREMGIHHHHKSTKWGSGGGMKVVCGKWVKPVVRYAS